MPFYFFSTNSESYVSPQIFRCFWLDWSVHILDNSLLFGIQESRGKWNYRTLQIQLGFHCKRNREMNIMHNLDWISLIFQINKRKENLKKGWMWGVQVLNVWRRISIFGNIPLWETSVSLWISSNTNELLWYYWITIYKNASAMFKQKVFLLCALLTSVK